MIGRWGTVDPLAENHYDHTPYNYVLGNPVKYADFMGLDTITLANQQQVVKAGDDVQIDNGSYVKASVDAAEVTANANEYVAYLDDYNSPSRNTSTASTLALGVRSGPLGAVVVGAVALSAIMPNLPRYSPPTPGFGDPSKWHYTYRPPSLDPINNPPEGFDPEKRPQWGGPVRWFLVGTALYEIYDNYDSRVKETKPAVQDNTRVTNPVIKRVNK